MTTVEVVPTMIWHQNGHIDNTHYDDFIAAKSQQGLK